jgi:large subunit ribosomal protein L10
MKTKVQKNEELKKAKELLAKSQSLIFADFSKITAEEVRKLRGDLKKQGMNFLVIKKRLLGILLKERGIEANLGQFKTSVGTIFAEENIEKSSGPAFSFFSNLALPDGAAKDLWVKHLLGGYDMKTSVLVSADQIVYIGKLPSREILLGQLLGMMSAPIRSFLYVLDQKAKSGGSPSASSNPDPEQKVELTQAQAQA